MAWSFTNQRSLQNNFWLVKNTDNRKGNQPRVEILANINKNGLLIKVQRFFLPFSAHNVIHAPEQLT